MMRRWLARIAYFGGLSLVWDRYGMFDHDLGYWAYIAGTALLLEAVGHYGMRWLERAL